MDHAPVNGPEGWIWSISPQSNCHNKASNLCCMRYKLRVLTKRTTCPEMHFTYLNFTYKMR